MVISLLYADRYMEVDATKLRNLREARILSLRELADESGVSYNTIWFIEAGRRRRTHPRTIRKLANALGVEPKALLLRKESTTDQI